MVVDETPKTNPIEYVRSRGHYTLRTVAICTLILALGIVIGGGGMYKFRDRIAPRSPIGDPEKLSNKISIDMQKKYALSDEETTNVKIVFLKHFTDLNIIREKAEEDSELVRKQFRTDLKNVLPKDKFTQWEKDMEDMQKRHRARMERWRKEGGRGGPNGRGGRGDRRSRDGDRKGPGGDAKPDGQRSDFQGKRPPWMDGDPSRRPGMRRPPDPNKMTAVQEVTNQVKPETENKAEDSPEQE